MDDKRTWPNATLTCDEAMHGKKSWKYWKTNVPQVLTSPLMSPFTIYTANQSSRECDILVHHERFHSEMESSILIHWRGDHKLHYCNVVIQC